MRTIKFRAWDKKENKIIIEPPLKYLYGKWIIEYADVIKENFELMQSTGLKDKNGVEIYEGDIILGKFKESEAEDWLWLSLTDEEKKSGSRQFVVEDLTEFYRQFIPDDIEVIGNIYENPELLESK